MGTVNIIHSIENDWCSVDVCCGFVLAPNEKMAELLKKTIKEAKDMISKVRITVFYFVMLTPPIHCFFVPSLFVIYEVFLLTLRMTAGPNDGDILCSSSIL